MTASPDGSRPAGQAYFDREGRATRFLGTLLDITERKRAEEQMRREREWLSVTLSSIGDAVIATDGDGRVMFSNPVAGALTGWTQEEAAGRPLGEVFVIVNEATRQPAESPVDRVIREGVVVGLANHTVVIARDGTETRHRGQRRPDQGCRRATSSAWSLVFQDATERRRHEAALRESEERHRAILESIGDGFFAADRDWRFTYVNPQGETILGRKPGRTPRQGPVGGVTPDWRGASSSARYRRAADEGVGRLVQLVSTRTHDRWYDVRTYPAKDGLSVYFQDVTERKRAEAERDRLVEQVMRSGGTSGPSSRAAGTASRNWTWTGGSSPSAAPAEPPGDP